MVIGVQLEPQLRQLLRHLTLQMNQQSPHLIAQQNLQQFNQLSALMTQLISFSLS